MPWLLKIQCVVSDYITLIVCCYVCYVCLLFILLCLFIVFLLYFLYCASVLCLLSLLLCLSIIHNNNNYYYIPCLSFGVDCVVVIPPRCLPTIFNPNRNSSKDILPSLLVSIVIINCCTNTGSSSPHCVINS